ncbi:MAG: amidohydrolase family protein [Bryobacteraceae bacterium]
MRFFAAAAFSAALCVGADSVAFVDVNVVPMDRNIVLAHQTVIVRGDRITEAGPAKSVRVPHGALVVDGRHRYLMPGLTDFHVHMPETDQDRKDELKLFIANGITTVVNMRGTPEILALRNQVRQGEVIGPTIYTTGPYINEPEFTTPEQVRDEAIAQKRAGYDFIKIHGELSSAAYAALSDAAREQHIRVVGHVPAKLGIHAVLGRQSLIVHAEEFLNSGYTSPAEIAKETARAGTDAKTWVSPTLAVFREIIYQVSDIDSVLQRPEMKYLPPAISAGWQPAKNVYVLRWKIEKVPHFRAQYAALQALTRALRDAGVPLLAGTDCLTTGIVPGFSMQDELNDLRGAGLTPYEALRAATENAAEFLGIGSYGTVSAGKRADLVLLEANPLADITSVSNRAGVMLRGKWRTEDELRKEIDRMAASYAGR